MKEREPERRPLFDLGQVVATPGALSAVFDNLKEHHPAVEKAVKNVTT